MRRDTDLQTLAILLETVQVNKKDLIWKYWDKNEVKPVPLFIYKTVARSVDSFVFQKDYKQTSSLFKS